MQTCDCGFLYVARQADPRIGEQISDLGLVGVSVYDEDRRVMPGGSTGRSVIGKTDIDGIGTAGLERQHHALLQGSPGEMTLEVAPNGRAIAAGTGQVVQPATPGSDISRHDRPFGAVPGRTGARSAGHLTGAVGGQIIVMDTDTGDIIAMVSVDRNTQSVPMISGGNCGSRGVRARLRRQGDHARRGNRGGHRYARHDVRVHPVGLRLRPTSVASSTIPSTTRGP